MKTEAVSRHVSVAVAATGLACLVVLCALTACQYDPYTLSYATTKPESREIIGHWVATDAALRALVPASGEKARPTIDVLEDGSIRMSDIPDSWRSLSGEDHGTRDTFVGTWKLEKDQNGWWGLELRRGDWGCAGCLMVVGRESPRKLVVRFGDPDQGLGNEFRKAPWRAGSP